MDASENKWKYNQYIVGASAIKHRKTIEEIDDCFLHVKDIKEEGKKTTYVLRCVFKDFRRIIAGLHYRCHNIQIGEYIHNLRVIRHDAKSDDARDRRSTCLLLGLTPLPSCAKVSFVLIGDGNKEIYPEDKGTLAHFLDRKCFSEFSDVHCLQEHLDLVALCKITVDKTVRFVIRIEASSILQNFEALYDNGNFSDLKIGVGTKEFNVHKIVLAARSSVFSAMFQNETKENSESRIEIKDSNETAIAELLRYLYCEKTIPLTVDLALDLFELADKYDIPPLRLEAVNYLRCNFSTENILDIAVSADLHDEKTLKQEAIEFISLHLWYLLKSPKWKKFRTHLEVVDCILAYLS